MLRDLFVRKVRRTSYRPFAYRFRTVEKTSALSAELLREIITAELLLGQAERVSTFRQNPLENFGLSR